MKWFEKAKEEELPSALTTNMQISMHLRKGISNKLVVLFSMRLQKGPKNIKQLLHSNYHYSIASSKASLII